MKFNKIMDEIPKKNVYRGMNAISFFNFRVLSRFFSRQVVQILVLLLLGLLQGCAFVEARDEPPPAKITFLDVGQGLAVLLEEGGRYALFDTGPDSIGFVDTLLSRGIHRLEWVLISHAHRDHGGGFLEFAQAVEAGRISVGRVFVGPDAKKGFVRDSVLRLAKRLELPVDTLSRGDMLDGLSDGASSLKMEVVWPPRSARFEENAASVVLLVSGDAGSALLTADLDSAGERKLLESSPSLRADLLQVPHHGSAYSSTMHFLSSVEPGFAVVSVGSGNAYGHPAQPVMQKLSYVIADSASVFRTDLDGSVFFEWMDGIGLVPGMVKK